jgi:elongation factor P
MSQIVATQIRTGMVLDLDGDLYKVTDTQHVTPGKGVACMQTRLKNIQNGKNLDRRFRSADRVERADLETRKMQFLYDDGTHIVLMDTADFEQRSIPKEGLGPLVRFLTPETEYEVLIYEGQIVDMALPQTVELKVTMAPPEIRRATASASLRPVELENGMTVNAPSFIKEGDIVRINTATSEYIERV